MAPGAREGRLMGLLRKRTQADELERRKRALRAGGDLEPPLLELLTELELPVSSLDDGWLVDLGEVRIALLGVSNEGVIAGMLPLPPVTEAEGLFEFLTFNLEQHLAYYAAAAEPPELDARIRILAEPFEREATLQGLQALAEVAGAVLEKDQSDVLARIQAARDPLDADVVRARAGDALAAGLAELGLEGIRRDEDQWEIVTARGPLGAVLDPRGETWIFLHPLNYARGYDNEVALRWLLACSAARASRLGFRRDGGEPQLFSAFVASTRGMNTWRLAYVLEDVLRVSDQYDDESRKWDRRGG